jgi:pyruvate,water dikinase
MGGFWRRIARLLPPAQRRQGRLSVEAKFTLLRAIGAANDTFLASLARYQEGAETETPPGPGAVAEAYEGLSAPVGEMVRSLLTMSRGRYVELARRYEALDRELARDVFGSEPVEVGPLVVSPEDAEACRPVRERLRKLMERVTPLTLTDPESPTFDPAHCRTLHDVARFVHQRAMGEMSAIEELTASERRACRRLVWHRPMEVRLLDLGGAVGPETGREVTLEDVTSVPLHALLEGMLDSRLRWAGPVGFDLKGFVSVVVRSAADDQRYGEPSYALCSADYLHFASRLAYHFALVDALCGESLNENYVRFRFHGGAAVAERREWRGQFLVTVLEYNRFLVTHVGDRVNAILPRRPVEELEDALVMLGRLMVASRHLDMVIESPAVAVTLARAFLAGDYGFDLVRKQAER